MARLMILIWLINTTSCGFRVIEETIQVDPSSTVEAPKITPVMTVTPRSTRALDRQEENLVMDQSPIPGTSLADGKCLTPCWNGITPGTTTVDELLAVLGSDQSAEGVTVYREPSDSLALSSIRWTDDEGIMAEALFYSREEEVIIGINVDFYSSVRLEDVQKSYGDPSHIIFRVDPGEHPGDQISYTLSILYLDHGFELGYVPYGEAGISQDTIPKFRTKRVTFFPTSLQGYLALQYSDRLPSWVVPWSAEKSLRDYCIEGHVGENLWLADYCPD